MSRPTNCQLRVARSSCSILNRGQVELAASFEVEGKQLERFYHFWYNNDKFAIDLIEELGLGEQLIERPSKTGMYFAANFYRLAKPLDLLRFAPLRFVDRLRLGYLTVAVRSRRDWRVLDRMSAADWLRQLGGERVFKVVWEPLLLGKFGSYAYKVSAAWFWSKLVLRGSSRDKKGREALLYLKGGFAFLANKLVEEIKERGGCVLLGTPAYGLVVKGNIVTAVQTSNGQLPCAGVIATPALPIVADLMEPHVDANYAASLRRVSYLANVCLVLQLDRSLSGLYWMNVNDPSFPFVAIIEHTNFEPSSTYGGRHIVYLSKYLPKEDKMYEMSDDELLSFALVHIRRMFPDFDRKSILRHHVWRADYAQPVATMGFADIIPARNTPLANLKIATMAQIYPEDRGTNHAIRDGMAVATDLLAELSRFQDRSFLDRPGVSDHDVHRNRSMSIDATAAWT